MDGVTQGLAGYAILIAIACTTWRKRRAIPWGTAERSPKFSGVRSVSVARRAEP